MEIFAMAIRGGLSLLFGLLLGIASLLITRSIVPGLSISMDMLVWAAAVAATVAAFLGWLKPESGRRIILIGLALALVGGIIGSWLGFWYGEIAYPDGVRNVRMIASGNLRSPAVWTFITGAAIFSTAFGAVYYGFRLWRYREV